MSTWHDEDATDDELIDRQRWTEMMYESARNFLIACVFLAILVAVVVR